MARNKFDIDEELETEFNFQYLKRLLGYIKPYKLKIVLTISIIIISSLASLSGPLIIKNAIDEKIPNGDIKGLVILTVMFLTLLAVGGTCIKFRIRLMNEIGQNAIKKIRSDVFDHIQKLPFTYYDSRPHGKILIRVVNYVNSLSDLLSNGLINFVADFMSLIFIVIFMFFINAKLTLIGVAGLPLLVLAVFIIKNAQRKVWQEVSKKQSNMNAYIHESICGIKVTQSFTREEENLNIFRDLNEIYRKKWMSAIRIQYLMMPFNETISVITSVSVYLAGIMWIGGKEITVGILIAFVGYIGRFWQPITNIGNFYNSIIIAMAYLERIFETIDEKLIVEDLPGAAAMPQISGRIRFNNVCFCYEDGEEILHNVSLDIKEGETVALVGPTGAGKTTIVNLVSRFYDVSSGEVLIDEINVRNVTLESLRSQMGIMMQDTFIFSGSIADNIKYSKLDASEEEVIEAAKAVKAHDFIVNLAEGYDTQVNERGSRLSVGQRQLISFARALLANPRVLILDEATSSIDTKTEIALQEGLETLLKGRTSFIIAHRLSTIKNATRIMYIDGGNIIEQGTHEELMEMKGAYWKLFTAQYSFLEAV